jgi:spermidine/putrescine-binding protein
MIGGGYFAIPTGAPNAKAALALMKYYLQASIQSKMCDVIAYCMNLPGVTAQITPSIQKWVPLGSNLNGTYPEGGAYWATHLDCLTPVWEAWLSTGNYNGACS